MYKYDLAVIGGGPAGMMAAGRAAELGASVVLLEKNPSLGVKLLITGKGRCNITNNCSDLQVLVSKYGRNGKFLYSALSRFGTEEIIDFFESRGLKTKVERGNRVFPQSDRSMDVLAVLREYLEEGSVDVKLNSKVKAIKTLNKNIEHIKLYGGGQIKAKKYLVATGGKSYPATGSDGDAYCWLEQIGHNVIKAKAGLSPIDCYDEFLPRLEGLSLKNVEISIYKDNNILQKEFGEAIFTDLGMSGPVILNLSNQIEGRGDYGLSIDFKPRLDEKKLDLRILREFDEAKNKQIKNVFSKLLPNRLIPVFLERLRIGEDRQVNSISKEERKKIADLLKGFRLRVKGVRGFDKAIVSRGGVDIKELDPKTCRSKIIDNLYVAGELIDVDGPTGGYNLQICWSSGRVVGEDVFN